MGGTANSGLFFALAVFWDLSTFYCAQLVLILQLPGLANSQLRITIWMASGIYHYFIHFVMCVTFNMIFKYFSLHNSSVVNLIIVESYHSCILYRKLYRSLYAALKLQGQCAFNIQASYSHYAITLYTTDSVIYSCSYK